MTDRCSQCGRKLPTGGPGDVPVEPLREAFLRSGVSAYELAIRLGWTRAEPSRRPDVTRVKRSLGLMPYRSNGRRMVRRKVRYERAVELADAMNVDPYEVGI